MHQDNTSADWLSSLFEYLSCLVFTGLMVLDRPRMCQAAKITQLEDSCGLSRMKAKKEGPFKQTTRAVHKNAH